MVLELFPAGTRTDPDGMLVLAGCRADELAARFGTPAFVVDEAQLRSTANAYVTALHEAWPRSRVVFASKAFPCTAVYRLMAEEGVGADVAGGGELTMALAAGVEPAHIVVHGNAKTDEELAMSIEAGVGLVVVDNHDDIDRLERLVTGTQPVLVRVIPSVVGGTYDAMETGGATSKFGLPIEQAREVVARLRNSSRLRLDGLHVHVGSQIMRKEPFTGAVEAIAELGEFAVYDLGGGLGARYTYSDAPPSIGEYVSALTDAARRLLPSAAELIIEPGRSLVASSVVTLYRVVTVKRHSRTFVAVDGGMADNMEVALYGQRFEATVANRIGGGDPVELVGRHCESGDVIARDVALRDPRVGDLVAVPVTGAYCTTLVNNYNGARRPPVVFVRDGAARLVVRRDTWADLLARDA
jgi:diaminopimelate decarboxylase